MRQAIIAVLLLAMLAGCAGQPVQHFPQGDDTPDAPDTPVGGTVHLLDYALAQPVYPAFPAKPAFPEEGPEGGWEAYLAAEEKYEQDLHALRGEGLLPEEKAALRRFAAASLPLALAGHEGENAVYSPVSLWSALAMLAQCAQGDSRAQVLSALGADSIETLQGQDLSSKGVDCVEDLQGQVSRLWHELYTEDGSRSLLLANSVWLNSAMKGTYVQETLDTLANQYFAGTYAVPMGTTEADQAITAWVAEQTHGLIGSGEPIVQTEELTVALLASALYYRAGWLSPFFDALNTQDPFTDAAGEETTVDFMHDTFTNDTFLKRDGYQAAVLHTNLGSMTFFLPDEGVTPESLLREPGLWEDVYHCEDARSGDVRWSVPKFDVDSQLDLMDTLSRMGMVDLLDMETADLSALTNLEAYLSDAQQMCRVKVDEEGVEAAVTMMAATATSMPMEPEEICVMNLNRPFLFVIRVSDVPLFVGVVNHVG